MEYQVVVADKHSFTLSAKGHPEGEFRVTGLKIALSETNLFNGPSPDDSIAAVAQTRSWPLADSIRKAFSHIDRASQNSPLVRDLIRFRDTKLERLLQLLTTSAPAPTVDETVLAQPQNSAKVAAALRETVKRIERELPHYLAPEKDLGTFNWLKRGGQDPKLGFALTTAQDGLSPKDLRPGQAILFDQSGQVPLFDATTGSVFLGKSEKAPSAATVFGALCNSGTLGNEFAELNRGAVLRRVADPLIRSHELDKEIHAHAVRAQASPVRSELSTVIEATQLPVAGMIFLATPVVIHLANGSITALDLFRVAGVTVLASMMKRGISLALRARQATLELKDTLKGCVPPLPPPEPSILHTGMTALLDQAVSRSAGNATVVLGPRTSPDWEFIIPQVVQPDISLLPLREEIVGGKRVHTLVPEAAPERNFSITPQDDGTEFQFNDPQELVHYAIPAMERVHAIERGSQAWNGLHASALLREFSARCGIKLGKELTTQVQPLANLPLLAHTDETGTYPAASKPFSLLTKRLGLNRESWDAISGALQGACTLERLHESRRAQEIARAVLKKYFGEQA